MPYAIQQILDDQANETNNNKPIDMWTSQAEEQYQAQMQSLNSNICSNHTMNIGSEKFI